MLRYSGKWCQSTIGRVIGSLDELKYQFDEVDMWDGNEGWMK